MENPLWPPAIRYKGMQQGAIFLWLSHTGVYTVHIYTCRMAASLQLRKTDGWFHFLHLMTDCEDLWLARGRPEVERGRSSTVWEQVAGWAVLQQSLCLWCLSAVGDLPQLVLDLFPYKNSSNELLKDFIALVGIILSSMSSAAVALTSVQIQIHSKSLCEDASNHIIALPTSDLLLPPHTASDSFYWYVHESSCALFSDQFVLRPVCSPPLIILIEPKLAVQRHLWQSTSHLYGCVKMVLLLPLEWGGGVPTQYSVSQKFNPLTGCGVQQNTNRNETKKSCSPRKVSACSMLSVFHTPSSSMVMCELCVIVIVYMYVRWMCFVSLCKAFRRNRGDVVDQGCSDPGLEGRCPAASGCCPAALSLFSAVSWAVLKEKPPVSVGEAWVEMTWAVVHPFVCSTKGCTITSTLPLDYSPLFHPCKSVHFLKVQIKLKV